MRSWKRWTVRMTCMVFLDDKEKAEVLNNYFT